MLNPCPTGVYRFALIFLAKKKKLSMQEKESPVFCSLGYITSFLSRTGSRNLLAGSLHPHSSGYTIIYRESMHIFGEPFSSGYVAYLILSITVNKINEH